MEIVFFCRGNTVIYKSKKISPIVIERMSKNVSLHNMRYPLILSQRVRTLYRKTYFSFQRQLPIR
jgi:hypothetical protein